MPRRQELLDDFRSAIRHLVRRPFLTFTAGLCLALGVGVNAGVFGVVEGALRRPLPFGAAEQLVLIGAINEAQDTRLGGVSPDAFDFLEAAGSEAFTDLAAATNADFDVSDGQEAPERWSGARATTGFFDILDVDMIAGRGFDASAGPTQAVVSERLWRAHFGGIPQGLGAEVRLDGVLHRIVGIVPEDARFPAQADIWTPLDLDAFSGVGRTNGFLNVIGRRVGGMSDEAVAGVLARLSAAFREQTPDWISDGFSANELRAPQVVGLRPVLTILTLSAFAVLAMACLNAMSLFLVQVDREAGAAALQSALGATSRRLVSQSLIRFATLTAASAAAGTLVAIPVVRMLVPLSSIELPGFSVDLNPRVLGFATLVAAAATMATGLLPALATARVGASRLFVARGGTSSRRVKRMQGAVVVAQVALSVFLTVGAWMMGRYVIGLENESPGFQVEGVLTARIRAPADRFPDATTRAGFFDQILDGLAAMPGVVSVGAASAAPIADPVVTWSFSVEGKPPEAAGAMHTAYGRMTMPGYVETLGIPLLQGRSILRSDTDSSEGIVLVNRAFQEAYWPAGTALGKRIKRRTYDSGFPWLRIVGVVENVREFDLGDAFAPTIYFAQAQHFAPAGETMTLFLRAEGGFGGLEEAVRGAVARLDRDAAVFRVLTMRERIVESTGERKLGAVLLGFFGALGLALSLVGVYGVISESVGRRRRELGIRLALGASPEELVSSTLRHASLLALAGTVLGAIAITAAIPRAAALLPGLEADPGSVLVIVMILFFATLASALSPALRAGRTDVNRVLGDPRVGR